MNHFQIERCEKPVITVSFPECKEESYKALTLIYSFRREMAPSACIIQIHCYNQANKIAESEQQSWLRYEVPSIRQSAALCSTGWFMIKKLMIKKFYKGCTSNRLFTG